MSLRRPAKDQPEKFEFNTGVSDLMKANNEISSYLNKNTTVSKETKELVFSSMCNLLYPFSPHMSSEIYDLYLNKYEEKVFRNRKINEAKGMVKKWSIFNY